MKNINPLDWHGTKFIEYIPVHFATVQFRHQDRRAEVLSWLEHNVQGRFAIESVTDEHQQNIFSSPKQVIGFEDHAEATMYAMFYK